MSNDLLDLISEGKNAKRQDSIKKAAEKVSAERDKKPPENGPPIRSDIYHQLEWRALSITLVTVHTTCQCCGATYESPNPTIFIERYHRRHGRHLVEAHNFNLLSREHLQTLPRKQQTFYRESLYCQGCFLTQKEPLCLDQQPTFQTQESSPLTSLPCVPQQLATPLQQTPWLNTYATISKSMNDSSKFSEPSKPAGKAEYY